MTIPSKKYHLAVSVIILIPIALAYGFAPNFKELFQFEIIEIDLKNILRGTMGLYLAMVVFWVVGIYNDRYWLAATITNVLFMVGLGFGRLFSLMLDGIPSIGLLIGLVVEFLLAFWGYHNLRKYT